MANAIHKVAHQGRALWQKLPARRRVVLVGGTVGTLALVAFLVMRSPELTYSTLFSGLDPEDAGKVVDELKTRKIPYKVASGGTTILVPDADVHETRIALAQSGVPRGGGVGFEIFDEQSFGTTSFVEQTNYRRALQGELGRTIMALEPVDRARVHLALPEKSIFREDEEQPSASVMVRLKPGAVLSSKQTRGIVHLVASSVEGLTPDRVTVVDDRGAVLSGDDAGAGFEARRELESTLAHRIKTLVERVVGRGKVAVAVTAEIDHTHVETTEELYDKDRAALRSEAVTRETRGELGDIAAGIAGARGNLPGAPGPTTRQSSDDVVRLAETRNYEVSRTVSRTNGPRARVKRLHVALLVDGKPDPSAKEGEAAGIVPRTDEELQRIEALAREAAGLDAARGDRIEVHSVPFAAGPEMDLEPVVAAGPWFLQPRFLALGGGALVFLIVVVAVLLTVRRRKKGRVEMLAQGFPVTVGQLEEQLPGEDDAPVEGKIEASGGVAGLPAASPRQLALGLADHNTERAARLLTAWLNEPTKKEARAP